MEDSESVRVSPKKLSSTWSDPNMLGIIVALVAVVITLILFTLYKRSRAKRNGILLIGLCEAGKTLLYSRLVYKKYIQTLTSVKENMGDYVIGPTVFNIIDIPGHERLRGRFFEQFKPLARGLVFVIDSLSIQKDIKDVAEFLYNCLIDNYIQNNIPPLLILCNKQGEATAKGSSVIKNLLEKEMNILRTTQTNQLESLANTTTNAFLGKEGKDFEFSHLLPMRIDFAECSAIVGQDQDNFNIKELEEWIRTLV